MIGVVYGNIVQSTRGVISVALGAAVAAAGFVHLEERMSRKLFARRLIAAAIMALAIAMFHLGSSKAGGASAKKNIGKMPGVHFELEIKSVTARRISSRLRGFVKTLEAPNFTASSR